MTSSSGLRGHRRTYLTILESAGHALFKVVRYVLLRPLRPELEVIQNNCKVRFVGISQYVHFRFNNFLLFFRQDMIKEIMSSGRFPDKKYHNQYLTIANQRDPYESENDRQLIDGIRRHGQRCSSVCCTGAFIVETMLCVVINEDIREFVFDRYTYGSVRIG
jgi:hypothetical protein